MSEEDRLRAEPPKCAEGVDIRPIPRDFGSIERVGHLYSRSYPDDEVGMCEEAVADIEAASADEYSAQVPDAYLIVKEGGEPIDVILITDKPPWDDVEGLTLVVDLFIAPDKHGQGTGDALAGAALVAISCHEVGPCVESEDVTARRIYGRHGFTVQRAAG